MRLCAIFAHPDDESFSSGGTLARYSAAGIQVTLVTATSGEAGEVVSGAVQEEDLAAWRERELLEAVAALGIHELRLLRLPDGNLPSRSTYLYGSITSVLRNTQPQVVLTEDLQGITGHPDHIAVTKAVLRAFDDLGDSGPLKLYEHVLPQSTAPEGLHGTPDDYITTTLDVEAWREQMLAALRAHRSQVGDEILERFAGFPAPLLDHYVCVRTRVPILIPETDLFDGVTD
ncbi:MAG: PIG-L deacetylase family protein [Chloroflexota bacterium]